MRHDRLHACLLGGAIGDALGWPVEFLGADAIRERFGHGGITDLPPSPAQITDDTQMTFFTAEAVIRGLAQHDPNWGDLGWQSYRRWFVGQQNVEPIEQACASFGVPYGGWLHSLAPLLATRAPGSTCLSALIEDAPGTVAKPLNNSPGCGGVMRVAPVAAIADRGHDPFTTAVTFAAITHGAPNGYIPAGVYALTLAGLCQGSDLHSALGAALLRAAHLNGSGETVLLLRSAVQFAEDRPGRPDMLARLGAGWAGHEALAIALYCALSHPDDFAAAVRLAVNHDGDSDSTGSLTGALLGASRGMAAIPAPWRSGTELHTEIATLANDLTDISASTISDDQRERYLL